MPKFVGEEFFRMVGTEITDSISKPENTFIRWQLDLYNLYTGLFRWEGMPLMIDLNKVEQWLMYRGSVAFFVDEYVGPLILPYVTQGSLNAYGNPTTIRAYGMNGYQIVLEPWQYVIIYDNRMKNINVNFLRQYAVRLAQMDTAIDINVAAQRTPVLLTAENEGQLTSLKKAYRKMRIGDPVIAEIGQSIANGMKAFSTAAPIVFPDIQQQKLELLAEVLTFIGVPNRGKPKGERVITAEMDAINGHVYQERNNRLLCRQDACDRINADFGRYGINLSVDYAAMDYNYAINDLMVSTPEGGQQYGSNLP